MLIHKLIFEKRSIKKGFSIKKINEMFLEKKNIRKDFIGAELAVNLLLNVGKHWGVGKSIERLKDPSTGLNSSPWIGKLWVHFTIKKINKNPMAIKKYKNIIFHVEMNVFFFNFCKIMIPILKWSVEICVSLGLITLWRCVTVNRFSFRTSGF